MGDKKMSDTQWLPTSEMPNDGDSIWIAVLEWDGVHTHVDYAVAFVDVDGLIIKRYENNEYERWPPKDVLHWRHCELPVYTR